MMSECRCEPHASGTNRCASCRAEAQHAEPLGSAVALISAISKDLKADPSAACDSWLEKHGYDCETSRRRARERRAEALDHEIERLRAERETL